MTMTTILEITRRLNTHVEGSTNADDRTNLADFIWMIKHGAEFIGTAQIWSKLLHEFNALNSRMKMDSITCLSPSLVYAINGLMTHCLDFAACERFSESDRRQLLELAWRITSVWDAVLAGDIDDISEHVELEGRARTIIP